jgi:Arylsulfotransferase (ASST)
LVTPIGGDASYLIDMAGRVAHRWLFRDLRPIYGRLLPNSNLLALATDAPADGVPSAEAQFLPFEQRLRTLGANATVLVEVDWEGDVVWQYRNPAVHHDFVRLASGNTVLPLTIELSDEFSRRVRGGHRERGKQPVMLADDIIEVDAGGLEVKRRHVWQLLDPVRDAICPLEHRGEWTHVNGLDVTPTGDVVFSCREVSRVGLIDGLSGKLLWKLTTTSHQHHPTVLENGNIQLFDNGHHMPGISRSRVIEVNPRDSSIVWEFVASPPPQFYSSHISGAQRLPGENVLICEGISGRVFEITRKGEIVWEWQSPFTVSRRGVPMSQIFRAHRYGLDDPALAGRELDAGQYRELNRAYGLSE